jgi:hypothetical protein
MKKIFAIIFVLIFCLSSISLAVIPEPGEAKVDEIEDTASTVLGIIQWVGLVIAVAMVLYVGIKYLTSTAGKKAEAKETMVPILIGAALLALAPTVVRWIFDAVGGNSSPSTSQGAADNAPSSRKSPVKNGRDGIHSVN